MKTMRSTFGIILLVIGSIMLLNNINLITVDIELFWPLFMIVPGISFHLSYFNGRKSNPYILVPGAILTLYGLYFFFCIISNWQFSQYLWPTYLLGIGIGFFEVYHFGPRKQSALITAATLCGLAVMGFAVTLFHLNLNYLFPIILIIIGLLIIYQSYFKPS